ncbi:MAG: PepSY domain-containing protein [Pseudomonadota bacterium]|nr:PepSY domain-containing protein [Pseudomonadota bacterium]
MRKSWITTLSLSLLVAAAPLVANAASADLSGHAKIKMPEARQIALRTYPGKIVKEELEKESGGSGLRYSFDIKSKAGTHEVGVDASNGKVLENSVEGADND